MTEQISFDALADKYLPLFARIAEGALDRERRRTLPAEQIGWLTQAGFTGVRVPAEFGGDGASLPQLFRLLVALASADPHIAQALRGHFAFVEDRLYAPHGDNRSLWLRRFAAGELVGNAVTEIGSVGLGEVQTTLERAAGDLTITGRKYYTTGSIFADWIDTWAGGPAGDEVAALVSTDSTRVTVTDDWTGFGQRLTGSGTAVFDAAPVQHDHVYDWTERFPYQTAFYQLVLVSVSAGIARAAVDDGIRQITTRARAFSHGNGTETRHDPQVLESIGRLAAQATAAEAITVQAAEALQGCFDARGGTEELIAERKKIAEIRSAEAQLVATRASLEAATQLFEGLGASAVSTDLLLDRHWRNARTVASHNPVAFKARIIGDFLVNGTEPPYEWTIGIVKRDAKTER
ncbi:acyl-CoA dehydrogenase family protein [Galbitalea soli]|uniref:Monooxygenase n=1 Tax=Galbitalea soli TaxID=1268042 RepID=A0A7C9PP79_9MICO|nr:acyl-CoA dehydrogenase family protein [Galbitalea soli]NEM91971.1 monooxygenase [Galbitalea soli]NYJ32079.1 alkylation response protein AidB-like acyl-CoA dehydrogenase [Galbitalea soli]